MQICVGILEMIAQLAPT